MRPSPIIPSCIASLRYGCGRLFEGLFDGGSERFEALRDAVREVHAQRTAATFGEHVEIAARLRCLDDAERIFGARHLKISRIAASDLQEHATVWATLVGLAGRMQEAGAEAQAGGELLPVADRQTQFLHRRDMRWRAFDIGEQRDIVARLGPVEMSLQGGDEARRLWLQVALVARIGEQLDT